MRQLCLFRRTIKMILLHLGLWLSFSLCLGLYRKKTHTECFCLKLLLQTLFNFDRAENGFKRTMGKISCGHYLLFNQDIIRPFFHLTKRKESQYAVLFYAIFFTHSFLLERFKLLKCWHPNRDTSKKIVQSQMDQSNSRINYAAVENFETFSTELPDLSGNNPQILRMLLVRLEKCLRIFCVQKTLWLDNLLPSVPVWVSAL